MRASRIRWRRSTARRATLIRRSRDDATQCFASSSASSSTWRARFDLATRRLSPRLVAPAGAPRSSSRQAVDLRGDALAWRREDGRARSAMHGGRAVRRRESDRGCGSCGTSTVTNGTERPRLHEGKNEISASHPAPASRRRRFRPRGPGGLVARDYASARAEGNVSATSGRVAIGSRRGSDWRRTRLPLPAALRSAGSATRARKPLLHAPAAPSRTREWAAARAKTITEGRDSCSRAAMASAKR